MGSAMVATANEIEIFRDGARTTLNVLRTNLEGITHEESLVQPQPAGNCLNWVVGHLVCVYNNFLPLLKQEPVMSKDELKRYDRGSEPLRAPNQALQLSDLMQAMEKAVDRMDLGLANVPLSLLDAPAPASPRNNPHETVRSLLGLISFHQAYHAGQTGLLRRLIGKPGAIA